jgi:hypothetical protein
MDVCRPNVTQNQCTLLADPSLYVYVDDSQCTGTFDAKRMLEARYVHLLYVFEACCSIRRWSY